MPPARDPLSTPLRELPVNKQNVVKDQLPSVLSQSNLFNKGKAELIKNLQILILTQKSHPKCVPFIADSNCTLSKFNFWKPWISDSVNRLCS